MPKPIHIFQPVGCLLSFDPPAFAFTLLLQAANQRDARLEVADRVNLLQHRLRVAQFEEKGVFPTNLVRRAVPTDQLPSLKVQKKNPDKRQN